MHPMNSVTITSHYHTMQRIPQIVRLRAFSLFQVQSIITLQTMQRMTQMMRLKAF